MRAISYNDVLYRAAELAGRTRDKLPPSEATMLQGFLAAELTQVWNSQAWPEMVPDMATVAVSGRRFTGWTIGAMAEDVGECTATITCDANHGLATGMQVTVSGDAMGIFDGSFAVTVISPTQFTYSIPASGAAHAVIGLTVTVSLTAIGDILGLYSANPAATTIFHRVEFYQQDEAVRIFEDLATVYMEYQLPAPDLMSVASPALATYPIPHRFSNYLAQRAAGWLLKADGQEFGANALFGLAERTLAAEIQRLPAAPWWRGVALRRTE